MTKKKKKMNCRHGLEQNEEIQARRLKDRMINGDEETKRMFIKYSKEYKKFKTTMSFEEFLKGKDKIFWSAYLRYIFHLKRKYNLD